MTQQTLPSRRRAGKENYYKNTLSGTDLYRFYSNKYGTPKKGGCNKKIFSSVIDEFNKYISDCLVKGDKILLPRSLGYIQVMKKKQKLIMKDNELVKSLLLIDWNKTWNYWKVNAKAAESKKLVYFTNEHSDNYRYKFVWDKYNVKSTGIGLYSFKPSRLLSRRLAEYIMDEDTLKNFTEKC